MNILNRSVKEAKGESTAAKTKAKVEEEKVSLSDVDSMIHSGKIGGGSTTSADVRGTVLKKSGGKHRRQHWNKRFFVLTPLSFRLSYYKNAAAHEAGKDALGDIDVNNGTTLFLKEVSKNGACRFTLASATRELKLRAPNEAEYHKWCDALKPLVGTFRDLVDDGDASQDMTLDQAFDAFDDGDDSEDEMLTGRVAAMSVSARGAPKSGKDGRERGVTVSSSVTGLAQEGWLEKKQGGKEGKSSGGFSARLLSTKKLGKWEKRYFAIVEQGGGLGSASQLHYYHKPEEFLAKRPALDSMDLSEATAFVKETKKDLAKGRYRFTVKDLHRELKLRTDSSETRARWIAALTGPGRAQLINSAAGGGGDDDDDEDDDDWETNAAADISDPGSTSVVKQETAALGGL